VKPDGRWCVTGRRDAEGEREDVGNEGKKRDGKGEYGMRELDYNGPSRGVVRWQGDRKSEGGE